MWMQLYVTKLIGTKTFYVCEVGVVTFPNGDTFVHEAYLN